jgi:hypothetical protein
MLAGQRYVAEKEACAELMKNVGTVVVDVGGAPHRTYEHLGARGRYLMPSIVAGDSTRRGRAPLETAEHICLHRFEECTCYDGEDHVFLFTHSAYYIDPMQLWVKLSDGRCKDALAVEHHFSDMFGGFYDEAHWSIQRDTVNMTVAGNKTPYVHSLPPWQCGWVGGGGEVIEAEVLFSLDDTTWCVRLHPGKGATPLRRELIWGEVETDISKSGPVQFSSAARNAMQDNARFTEITFDVTRVHKFGPVLYSDFLFRGETVTLTVPVNGVSQVANHVLGRARTPELFSEVYYVMKNRWGKSRIPPVLLARTLTAVVAIGFVCNLHNEVDSTHTMITRFTWLMNAHKLLTQFTPIGVRWWLWLPLIFLFTMISAIAATWLEDEPWEKAITVIGAFCALLLLCCCGRGLLVAVQVWRRWYESGWVQSYSDPDGPRVPLLGNNFALQRNLPLPGARFTKPANQDITGRLSLEATRERLSEPDRCRVSGIVCDGALPNALATTQEAELSAVTNRVLATRENPTEEALKELDGVLTRPEFGGIRVGVDTSFVYFSKWTEKLKKSYPMQYIELMIDAWKTNQGVEAIPEATSGFLKIEKAAATVGVDHAKSTKPRLVQPPKDVDKAITGPIIWQLWDKIRGAWDGIQCQVMYCSGYSCSEIGYRVDKFIGEHGAVSAWSVDMASYDSTLCLPIQQRAFRWYNLLGVPKWLNSWFMRIRTRGTTPNGVKYMPIREYSFSDEKEANELAALYRKHKFKVWGPTVNKNTAQYDVKVEDFQMASGRADTNLTDTVILVMAILVKMPKIPYLLLACGDDGCLFLRDSDVWIIAEIQKYLLSLGMKPEGVVSNKRSDWEFCSKLFWHAEDPETGVTKTVLGSKPFRGITRMGINTTLPGAANAAASALSVRIDSGHVPFLGPFADRTYELCKERKIRPSGKAEWSAIKGDRRYNPSPLNYVITQERYNLGSEHEDEFKTQLLTLNSVPVVLHYLPVLDAVKRDEA